MGTWGHLSPQTMGQCRDKDGVSLEVTLEFAAGDVQHSLAYQSSRSHVPT